MSYRRAPPARALYCLRTLSGTHLAAQRRFGLTSVAAGNVARQTKQRWSMRSVIDPRRFRTLPLRELQEYLPAGNLFETEILARAGNSEEVLDRNVHVYDGSIDADVLHLYRDIFMGAERRFINETSVPSMAYHAPVVLGSIRCDVLQLHLGLIAGGVHTRNMSSSSSVSCSPGAQIMRGLTVSEFLMGTGVGSTGSPPTLTVGGRVEVSTLVNYDHYSIASGQCTFEKTFDFPQITLGGGRCWSALRQTDWGLHSIEEVREHFLDEVLDYPEWGADVDAFFRGHTLLRKSYHRYLRCV